MSLRARIALLVGVTVLVASAIGGLGTSISSRNVGRDRLDQSLAADADRFTVQNPRVGNQLQFAFEARRASCDEAALADDDVDADAAGDLSAAAPATRLEARLRFLPESASTLQLIRPNGAVIATCLALPVDDLDRELAEAGAGAAFRTVTIDGERFRVLTRGFENIGAVQFARSLAITEDTMRGLLVRTVFFGLIGAALASALGWVFATKATAPLKRLSQAAERVAHTNDLGERIAADSDDEIGALATSFNTMLTSLDTSREQQQRLVQDASHELRTPLTSMRTNVELLQRHQDIDPAVRAEILTDIGAELSELTELTTELVDSASEVRFALRLGAEADLTRVVQECADRARRRWRRTVTVTVQPRAGVEHGDTTVQGDEALLARAVTNLLNNAVKFSPDTTDIEVEVSSLSVLVRDRGPGVPAEDLPHLFDRFYRATAARSEPGSGLGLAIVKQIVSGHGGSVTARNRSGGGAEFGFDLPAN